MRWVGSLLKLEVRGGDYEIGSDEPFAARLTMEAETVEGGDTDETGEILSKDQGSDWYKAGDGDGDGGAVGACRSKAQAFKQADLWWT